MKLAIIPGFDVLVPEGKLVGGSFNMPLGVPNELRPISRIGWRGADPFGAPYHWRQVKTLPLSNVRARRTDAVVHGSCPEL